jgi:hypothetical protein
VLKQRSWENQYITSSEGLSQSYTVLRMIKGEKIVDSLIDNEDVARIRNLCWRPNMNPRNGDYYVISTRPHGGIATLARLLCNVDDPNLEIDHVDHNTVDNRKQNLKVTDSRGNASNRRDNTSHWPGIYFHARINRWTSQIFVDGVHTHFGTFKDKTDAILMTFAVGAKLFGTKSPYKTPSGRTAAQVFA